MYVIMCEIYAYKQSGFPRARARFASSHPVYAAQDEEEVKSWMKTEPDIIKAHLDAMEEDVWEVGEVTEYYAEVWNRAHTVKRIYVARFVEDK